MYTISRVDDVRMIIVPKSEQARWKFYTRTENGRTPVKLMMEGKNMVAFLHEEVLVMRKPNSQHFHYEYMRNSSRILAGWGGVEHDVLVENMMEAVESV